MPPMLRAGKTIDFIIKNKDTPPPREVKLGSPAA